MSGELRSLLRDEPEPPMAEAVHDFAHHLAETATAPPLAVLFYGSNLRSGSLDGVLDFYVLVEQMRDWHSGIAAFFDTRLPPRVEYHELEHKAGKLRAKVAIIPAIRFDELTRMESLDTTLWARFCQPVGLAWVRDRAARDKVTILLTQAVETASRWAALLGPEEALPLDYWRALFGHTYGAELRVERGRAANLLDGAEAHFERRLIPAWREAGIRHTISDNGHVRPQLAPGELAGAKRGWALRRRLGKPLNLARLCKAAFSFSGGAAYIVWKIERHTGQAISLTPWQERHPLLVAPRLLWRLWRQGIFK